jgi:aldehyde dehydrogenase (NAD+)
VTHTGYINGAFLNGEGARFIVENPSDESVVAEVNGVSAGQVDKALAAARESFDSGSWSGLTMKQRAETMRRYAEALKKRADKLKELAIAEAGCPINSTVMGAQVHAPLRMTDDIIDMFLTLPEHHENPLPLHERVNPYFVVQSLKLRLQRAVLHRFLESRAGADGGQLRHPAAQSADAAVIDDLR